MSVTASSRRARTGRRPSTTEWLELLAVDGPFLAAPVVKDIWPGGLPALDRELVGRLRDASGLLDASPGTRDAFLRLVLTDFLDWRGDLVTTGDLPPHLTTEVPEHATEVRPSFALFPPQQENSSAPLLLGMVLDPGVRPAARPRPGSLGAGSWTAGPTDRLAHALRAKKIPLGLVTDGTEWTLVCAPAGGATATATWTRHAWFDEPDTLKAFEALLSRQRFIGVDETETLPALLAASLDRQEEITERLSEQSKAVVEMLVANIGRLDAEHHAQHGRPLLPPPVEATDVYQAAVSVLMRLVFLLYAEERGLLPVDHDTYASAYAAGTLAEQLREQAGEAGEDALERSSVGWHRLLATFRAVHRGARHEQFSLPGYGGSLFDPDRFPWLEGRASADEGMENTEPLRIDDRTLLRALEALQWLRFAGERRRVSFRTLDVEQIGYVYEGLLDQDCCRTDEWVLGIAGDNNGEKDGPEVALGDLTAQLALGIPHFADWLSVLTKRGGSKRTPGAITRAFTPANDSAADIAWGGVLEACGGDEKASKAVMPFAQLLRRDPRGLPVLYPPGSLYLTESDRRATTGAVYTPRILAEEVVARTLEPLVRSPGPLDTEDESVWKIRKPDEILALKVIDIAAGSGAFLVAATRYLADRLMEARHEHASEHAVDADEEALLLEARRSVLDHCIYGIDINPMALEMAKLSLWLVTLDRTRPFGFLDDRLVAGDSLLGLTTSKQLIEMHFDTAAGRRIHNPAQVAAWTADVPDLLKQAAKLREQIAEIELIDHRAAQQKARLLTESRQLTLRLTTLADGLSGASLSGGSDSDYRAVASKFGLAISNVENSDTWRTFADTVAFSLTDKYGHIRKPAHFPLLFPEVFMGQHGGFDATIGNPPFLFGSKITGAFGIPYREHLVRVAGNGIRRNADLVVYMFLNATRILNSDTGVLGLIGVNTLAQGDSRQAGLDQIVAGGFDIYRAIKSKEWPTHGAAVNYCVVWTTRRNRAPKVHAILDDVRVESITSSLDPAGRIAGRPFRLAEYRDLAFNGSRIEGLGFTMSPTEASALISHDGRNAEILYPFISGEDLTTRPDTSASRWVINFSDWSEARASEYPDCFSIVVAKVKPQRERNARVNYRRYWWRYGEHRPGMVAAIAGLSRVIAIPRASYLLQAAFLPNNQVFHEKLVVIASDDPALLGLLNSSIHRVWALAQLKGGGLPTYAAKDILETLAQPVFSTRMALGAEKLDVARRVLMRKRMAGLTSVYNLLHDPSVKDADIAHLRNLHIELDGAVLQAYGWEKIHLDHGHYDSRNGLKWGVSPAAQVALLDSLLGLNHVRYANEQGAGQTNTTGSRQKASVPPPRKNTTLRFEEVEDR